MDVVEGFICTIIFINLVVFLAGGVAVAASAVLRHLDDWLLQAGQAWH